MSNLRSIIIAFLMTLMIGASCREQPQPTPTPSLGGWPPISSGGTAAGGDPWAAGGTPAAGSPSSVAGAAPVSALPFKKFECNGLQAVKPGPRPSLGRVHHKTQLLGRAKAQYLIAGGLSNVIWPTHLESRIDQTNIGRCTGYSVSNIYNNEPFAGHLKRADAETLGDNLYHWATVLDSYKGTWPPDDTGSDGVSAMLAATSKVKDGNSYLFTGFRTVSDFVEMQKALQKGPCIIGTNWYSSMFSTTRCGQVEISANATIEGEHQYGWIGMDFDEKVGWFVNSWSNDFGVRDEHQVGGYFKMSFGTIVRLLNEDGEVECPTPPPLKIPLDTPLRVSYNSSR
jgi:hypothetical protein